MAESSDHDNPEVILGVVGVGYVGLTTGACLAALGHRVVCGDIDADRVERLRAGVIPIVEEGLQPLVAEGIASGRLTFEVGAAAVAQQASIVFLCVPTPQDDVPPQARPQRYGKRIHISLGDPGPGLHGV